MALYGYMKLEMARAKKINNKIKREVVNRIEKHNTITGYAQALFKQGNFGLLADSSKLLPLNDNFFKGCLMTDKANDASLMMIAGNANIVAQCSNDAYSGDNLKRGSYNANESGIITNGYRHVMDWGTSQGNGTIASVCLCRPRIGATRIIQSGSFENETDMPFEHLSADTSLLDLANNIAIIDYDKEVGYGFAYSSGTITITEYRLLTKIVNLLGGVGSWTESEEHTITQTIANYSADFRNLSLSYTGDTIHVLTHASNGNVLNDYAIDTDDWTCTATSHTYSGVSFQQNYGYSAQPYKDVMPIINGRVWAFSNNGQKIVSCSLTSDADVVSYDNPIYTVLGISGNIAYNGSSVLLPNGDWYKIGNGGTAVNYGVYFHNNQFYLVQNPLNSRYVNQSSLHHTGFGGIIRIASTNSKNNASVWLDTCYPFVSTVANLDEAVTKSADLTMKLQYEITAI